MATYTAIAGSETNPGAPVTSSLMKRLAANPLAITEGASGAPRIVTTALVPPAPGNITIARYYNSNLVEVPATNTIYLDHELVVRGNSVFQPMFTVLRAGTIRAAVHHKANVASGEAWVRILRNLTVMDEWSTTSEVFVNRSVDFAVGPGDNILFQQRVSTVGQSIWRQARIMSDSFNLAVI